MASFVIDLRPDAAQLARMRKLLTKQQMDQALYQAVKRTVNTGKSNISKRVRQELQIKKKYVDRAISSQVSLVGDAPAGVINIRQKMLPLIAYGGRAGKRGITVKMNRNRPSERFRHAFKATVRTKGGGDRVEQHDGHEGYFVRARHLPTKGPNVGKGKLTNRGIAGRFTIRQLFGPSVLDVLGRKQATRIRREELAKLRIVLRRNLENQLKRFVPALFANATPNQDAQAN